MTTESPEKKQNRGSSTIKWVLVGFLLIAFSFQSQSLWDSFKTKNIDYLIIIMGIPLSLGVLFFQAKITQLIAQSGGAKVSWFSCVMINIGATLASVMIPLGAMGSKAYLFHRYWGIDWRKTTSMLGVSMLTNVLAAVGLFLLVLSCFNPWYTIGLSVWIALLGLGMKSGRWFYQTFNRLSIFNRFAEPFGNQEYAKNFLSFVVWHGLGLLYFSFLYILIFKSIQSELREIDVFILTCAQNVVLMASWVPGNLVLQEWLAGSVSYWRQANFEEGMIGSLILRLILWGGLTLMLIPFLFWFRKLKLNRNTS